MKRKIIYLNAKRWNNISDFIDDLKSQLKSPSWHGNNLNALIDSIIYEDINEIKKPYTIFIINCSYINIFLLKEIKNIVEILLQENNNSGTYNDLDVIFNDKD